MALMFSQEEVAAVSTALVQALGLDPATVTDVYMDEDTVEVGYINPEEPAKVISQTRVNEAARMTIQILGIDYEELQALYVTPKFILVKYPGRQVRIAPGSDVA